MSLYALYWESYLAQGGHVEGILALPGDANNPNASRGPRPMADSRLTPIPFRSDLLVGKQALVTGSSSGIGRATAILLASAGADVHLHARSNQEGLREVREQIRKLGRSGRDFLFDLSDEVACNALVGEVTAAGPIDIWVNNAGADVLTGEHAHDSFEAKLTLLWKVDVRGTIQLGRAIGQVMRDRGEGSIVNIGWDQADFGMEGASGEMFGPVKGGVMSFTRSLARSLAPAVRVNCVAPGWIRTAWGDDAPEYWDRRAQAEALLERWGEASDVAQAIVFLASPAAGFITGQVLAVNGGFAGPYRG